MANKAFDADPFRAQLRRHLATFHRGYFRQRHKIENSFGRLKRHPRVGTRYDKIAAHFLGFVLLAVILDWLTH